MSVIKLVGTVYTGQSCGKFFVELPWVILQLKELTGLTPYLGTLNLRLTPDGVVQRRHLTSRNGMLVKPKAGYLSGYLYKARIFGLECYVVLPDVPSYPKNVLEILAAENLRNQFNVKDGDTITVLVTLN